MRTSSARRTNVLLILATLSSFGLTACDTIGMSPAQIAAQESNAAMRVTCSGSEDCEKRWARALDWVQRNSHWKLRTVTDTVITTEGPLDTTYAAFEITKFPLGSGRYELRFRAGCGNIFGCVPSIQALQADFNVSVGYTDASDVSKTLAAPAPPVVQQTATANPATPPSGNVAALEILSAASVPIGATADEVRRRIGRDPDQKEQITVDGIAREIWFYSSNKQKVTLTFRGGKLSDVSIGAVQP